MTGEGWYFRTLLQRARRDADKSCLELYSAKQTLSFAQMARGIAAAAARLRAHGTRDGDVVLIFAQHDAGTFWAFFGAQALGAIPSFMSPPTSRQPVDLWTRDHGELIARIEPRVIVCGEELLGHFAKFDRVAHLTTRDIETDFRSSGTSEFVAYDENRIAFLQHSSGTTGLKKGVAVTYRQLRAQVESYAGVLTIGNNDCVVSWLPVYHDMGLIAATLMPFALGLPISLIDTTSWLEDPSIYLTLLAARPHSFSWLPNFAFPFLAHRGFAPTNADLSKVRAIINCSEPCKVSSMEAFRARFTAFGLPPTAIRVCYAMAEYVFAVTQTEGRPRVIELDPELFATEHRAVPKLNGRQVVSVGRQIPGADIRIENGLTDGQVGEVFVRGESLCSGYFRAPEITADKFIDGWYRTGDLGFLYDGELYITGRRDDIIIVRGKNLYAHDVELLATETGMVRAGRVVAFGVEDEELGTDKLVIVAEVGPQADKKLSTRAVRVAVRETYGLSPADVLLVPPDTLVKTSSGKISRSENRRRYLAGELKPWISMEKAGAP